MERCTKQKTNNSRVQGEQNTERALSCPCEVMESLIGKVYFQLGPGRRLAGQDKGIHAEDMACMRAWLMKGCGIIKELQAAWGGVQCGLGEEW